MAEGLDWCWRFVPELFEVDETLQAAIDAGIAPDPREFEDEYRSAIAAVLPKRSWKRRPTSARSSAAGAATTASISAICSRRCSSCRAPTPTRPGRWPSIFTRLRVAEIVPETAEANSIRFEIPAELRDRFAFKAGQHLTLRATIDGEEVRRNYSLCTAPDESDWMVTVKRIGGGLFSNWVGDQSEARRHGRRHAAARQLHHRIRRGENAAIWSASPADRESPRSCR